MTSNQTQLSHEQVVLTLPAYINGKLSSEQQRQIQEHIGHCESCAEAHLSDLQLSRALSEPPAALESLLSTEALNRNRQQLLQRIDHPNSTASGRTTAVAPRQTPTNRWHTALAAGIGVIALSAALMVTKPEPATDPAVSYQTRSAAAGDVAEPLDPAIRVVFHPDQSDTDIRNLLSSLDATVRDGPSETGVYTLTFDHSSTAEVLISLRRQAGVLLAEKAVNPDR